MGTRLDTKVIEVALRLQSEDEERARWDIEQRALQETARELGLDARQLERARALVDAEQMGGATRRRRVRVWAAALAAAIVGVAGIAWAFDMTRPEPWSSHFGERTQWELATSRSTVAMLRWPREPLQPGAIVTVDYVAKDEDGDAPRWYVDLEGHGLPEIDGHDSLTATLYGTLPHARIDLHAGPDERWRSPMIDVRAVPSEHRLRLRSFEHQRQRGGKWRPVDDGDEPTDIDRIVVKLGVDVNPPEMGWIRVDTISVE